MCQIRKRNDAKAYSLYILMHAFVEVCVSECESVCVCVCVCVLGQGMEREIGLWLLYVVNVLRPPSTAYMAALFISNASWEPYISSGYQLSTTYFVPHAA